MSLATVSLIVAVILFILSALDIPSPQSPRLVPLGLAFLTAALLLSKV